MLGSQNNSQKRSHKKKEKTKKKKRQFYLIFIKIVEKFEKPLGYYLLQMHNPRFILHTNSPRGLKICKNKNLKLLKIIF
jgi:hypothetical protein